MIGACGLFEQLRFFVAVWIGPHRLRCYAMIEFDLRFLEFFILFTVFYSYLYFCLDFILFYTFLSILAGSKHGLLSCLPPYTGSCLLRWAYFSSMPFQHPSLHQHCPLKVGTLPFGNLHNTYPMDIILSGVGIFSSTEKRKPYPIEFFTHKDGFL